MDLQLRHLTAFVALCEEGTYTRAAARLRIAQPSLTRTIQDLERILECDLVVRPSRRFELTANGELFLQRSRGILTDVNELQAEMRTRSEVRVGFAWLLPSDWFAAARARYDELGGQVTLHRNDNPAAALQQGTIDIAVTRTCTQPSAAITWRRIGTEQRVLAVSARSELAHADGLHWADLAHQPLVVNTQSGTTTPDCWPDPDPAREIVTCGNFDEWIELVAADRGIGAVPAIATHRAPHPDVVYRELPDIPASTLYLGWRRTPPPPRSVRRFLDAALTEAHP